MIDELRISDVPRVGNSDSCGRLLVADSGNQRIQAFDMLGYLLSAYGSLGSGAGQFNSPQGLAVDRDGRVIVADQGNNRLVVLSFDGIEFSYLDSLTGGFNAPSGVAVDTRGNLAIADTGNNRIVVLDPRGDFLAEFTEPNDGYSGAFNAPRGVAMEACGTLVVADTGNHRVVTVRGALPGCRTWLPLLSLSRQVE
jgi:tripartite motif-containing protein 71